MRSGDVSSIVMDSVAASHSGEALRIATVERAYLKSALRRSSGFHGAVTGPVEHFDLLLVFVVRSTDDMKQWAHIFLPAIALARQVPSNRQTVDLTYNFA